MPVNWERRHDAFKAIYDKIAEVSDKPNLVGFMSLASAIKDISGFYGTSSYDWWGYFYWYAYNIGNYVEIEFEGRILGIVCRKGTNCGIIKVEVDGEEIGTIDNYQATNTTNNAVFITDSLSDERHTVRFEIIGKNPLSTGNMLYIQGILVSKLKNLTDFFLYRSQTVIMDHAKTRFSKTFTLDADAEQGDTWRNHSWFGYQRLSINIKNGGQPFEVYVDIYNMAPDNYAPLKTYTVAANERKADDFFCSATAMRLRAKNVGTESGVCVVECTQQM